MSASARYIILQYLVHGGAALGGFLLSAFLLGDPAPLVAVKTIFPPACLLASTGLAAHFQRKGDAPPPLWQVIEYSAVQGMMVASFTVILPLDLNQTGNVLLSQFAMVATCYGATTAFLSLRKARRSPGERA